MKRKLANAPLVLSILHLRFSEVPSFQSKITGLMDELHGIFVELGFPEKIESKGQNIEINFNQDKQSASHITHEIFRYLFRAPGEQQIIEILKDSIILKSTKYTNFDEFHDLFNRILEKVVPLLGIDKVVMKSIGSRHVDLIVPEAQFALSDIIEPGLQTPSFSFLEASVHKHGFMRKELETGGGQSLRVVFEELPITQKRISKILPDDLIEPDKKCTLRIMGKESWASIEYSTYAILDVDHTHTFQASPLFDMDELKVATKSLHENSSNVFWSVITAQAKTLWGYEEI
jgi:uncharacterized protein (TIGR04255 family)